MINRYIMPKNGSSYIIPALLIVSLYTIYLLAIKGNIIIVLLFAILPAILLFTTVFSKKHYYFHVFFIVNYLIMGISRYVSMKTGIVMLGITLGILVIFLIKNIFQPYEWKRCLTLLTMAWVIWFIYCLLELFNPLAVIEAWNIAIAGYALLPLLCAIIVPILFTKFNSFKWLLIIWAFLTLLAAFKGYWQKNHGFDATEIHWLFVEGGAKTHILLSGLGFFSFFSDAANYGISMGLSMTVFGISSFFVKPYWVKFLFWGATIAAIYGLMISGTRSAVVIPFVSLIAYTILCKNMKHALLSGGLFIVVLLFLTQTNIGNGYAMIRRVRSTFNKEDASLQVRYINKEKMKPLMKDKPFGIGLGLSGKRSERFNVHEKLSKLPPDSLLTMYWIDTGIVGLSLYLTLLVLILTRSSYIAMFVIKNKHLKNITYSLIAGLSGTLVAAYVNDITTYPNGVIMSILFAFVFAAPYYDKELTQNEQTT